jgi:hypothetical protein
METPNKMIGGIAGAMAQQAGVLGGATNLGAPVQPNQMQQSPINPQLLTGGFNPQLLTGVPQPTQSFNNIMPQNK